MTLIPALTNISNGDTSDATIAMANWNAIRTVVNGQLDSTNMNSTGVLLTPTTHGDLTTGTGSTGTMHNATSVKVLDTANYFTGTNVETIFAEVGLKIGTSISGASSLLYIGSSYDTTVYPGVQPSMTAVPVGANAAPNGILVELSADILISSAAALGGVYVPLKIDSTDLSASGTGDRYRFRTMMQLANDTQVSRCVTTIVYTVADGWTPTASHTVTIGTVYESGTIDNSRSVSNYMIHVYALR